MVEEKLLEMKLRYINLWQFRTTQNYYYILMTMPFSHQKG